MTPPQNPPPPAEPIAVKNDRPERLAHSEPLANPADESEVSALSQAVATALGSNEQKIETLRQQVSDGTYVIDSPKIIEKMLDAQIPK